MSIPTAVWSGELRVGDLVLRCHVLDNGQRMIDVDSLAAFLNWLEAPTTTPADAERVAAEYAVWMRGGDR